MSPFGFAKSLIVAALCCLPARAQSPVVIYENTAQPLGSYEHLAEEYGDEIILSGTARVVTRVEFEYFGDFTPQGDERARIRFYRNNGPLWKNNRDYKTPEEVLWEGTFDLLPAEHSVSLRVPYITVPDNFTWTVKFSGLAMTPGDKAGLFFYGAPNIGGGWNDFWVFLLEGWTPLRHPELVKNNFACRLYAVQSAPPRPTLTVALEGINARVSWPTSVESFVLESKASVSAGPWTPVAAIPTAVGETFQTVVPVSGEAQIFRLNTEPEPLINVSAVAGGLRLRWAPTLVGQTLQGRASLNSGAWVDLSTPSRPTGGAYEMIIPTDSGNQFFRLQRIY